MIKLLLVIPTLDRSGAEKQFALLAGGLPRERFDVRVVALSRGGPYEALLREWGIPVVVLHKRRRIAPRSLWQLRRLIHEWQPDVVLSGLFSANASSRLALIGSRRRPAVVISERCVDSWKAGWQLWLDRRLAARAAGLVANSHSVADFYAAHGFPRDRITVIPNGVAVPPPPALSRQQLCAACGLPPDARLVMYAGRLAPQKRLKDAIWAAQLLRQAEGRTCFLIVGDGPERDRLELYARDVEVTNHIRFLGPRDDAASLLHLCDVFWLASEFEGMSNSLMEAMACGKPVVVSDIPPNRELVSHGADGWIANLGDSVGFCQFTLRLFADAALAARMGAAGKAKMESKFSVDAMIDRFADMLESAAGHANPRSPLGPR